MSCTCHAISCIMPNQGTASTSPLSIALATNCTLQRGQGCSISDSPTTRHSVFHTIDVHDCPSAGVVEANCRSTTIGAGNGQAQLRLAPTHSLPAGPDAPAAPLQLSSQRMTLFHSDHKGYPAARELDPSVIFSRGKGPQAAPQGYGIWTFLTFVAFKIPELLTLNIRQPVTFACSWKVTLNVELHFNQQMKVAKGCML